jgi:hypothetical protein
MSRRRRQRWSFLVVSGPSRLRLSLRPLSRLRDESDGTRGYSKMRRTHDSGTLHILNRVSKSLKGSLPPGIELKQNSSARQLLDTPDANMYLSALRKRRAAYSRFQEETVPKIWQEENGRVHRPSASEHLNESCGQAGAVAPHTSPPRIQGALGYYSQPTFYPRLAYSIAPEHTCIIS